jgi:hypothetical protein
MTAVDTITTSTTNPQVEDMKNNTFNFDPTTPNRPPQQKSDFEEFEAVELYCPDCRQAMPVRKFLLLVLPEGDKYEYRCEQCGAKVGDKMDRSGQYYGVLKG